MDLASESGKDWRFTNLKNIRRKSFLVPTYTDISAIDLKFDSYYRKGFIPLVFHNGHFLQPTRTNFKNLAINFDANFKTLMKYNGLFPENKDQPFELLNSAFMDSKMEITIKGNNYYEKPLHFIFIYDNKEELMISPRTYLNISSNSSATILEEHIGDSNSFLNYSKFINIHRNAHLNHTKIHSNSKNRISISSSVPISVARRSGSSRQCAFNRSCRRSCVVVCLLHNKLALLS